MKNVLLAVIVAAVVAVLAVGPGLIVLDHGLARFYQVLDANR